MGSPTVSALTGGASPPQYVRVRFGAFTLDEADARLLRDGEPVALPPKPFDVLCALVRKAGKLVTKAELLDTVWGHAFVSESVLKTVISDLRMALGDDAKHSRYIASESRRGYRFIAVTSVLSAAVAQATSGNATSPPFVGRAKELARLRQAWEHATRGEPAIVWVAGEPGIGKTALIEEFVAGLGDVACVRGYCIEHYGEPYLPVLEALGQLCRADASVQPLLDAVAPMWLLQLPWLGTSEERERLHRTLVGVSPDRMLREMGEFLDRYTEQRPLLLLTEDLHWADRATIQLLDYFARRRGRARVMWLSSFRLTEVIISNQPLGAVRQELRGHGLRDEIVLDPFSETEVAAYLTERAPSIAVDEGFVRALHQHTDGVPLFVASVTNDVLARDDQRGREILAAAAIQELPVPESLTAIIDHYLQELDDDRRALLSTAAVCGVAFRGDTVARMLQRDPTRVTEACEQLVREQRWLAAPGRGNRNDLLQKPYSFRHALFREVLYAHMAPSTRLEFHRKAGESLEEERAAGVTVAAAELAMHFDRGRSPIAALRYYAESAENALLHFHPEDCFRLTERALSLLDDARSDPERTSLEIALATLRGVSGLYVHGVGNETKTALQRAWALLTEHPGHRMRALALHQLGFLLTSRAEFAGALAAADRADALASGTADPLLPLIASIVRGHVYMLQGRPHAARHTLETVLPAIEAAEPALEQRFIADPSVWLLGILSVVLTHLGLVRQARERLDQAYARAHQLGQPMGILITIWCDTRVQVRLGDVERVAMLAAEMRKLVEQFALAHGRGAWRWFLGWVDARKGKPLEGFRQIREARDESKTVAAGSENLGYAAEALLLLGDCQGAQAQLDQALEVVETYGERMYLPQLLLIESAIAQARGEPDAAIASIRRAIEEAQGQGAKWLELLARIELSERRAANADDLRVLSTLVDQLEEAADTNALARARALVARGLSA